MGLAVTVAAMVAMVAIAWPGLAQAQVPSLSLSVSPALVRGTHPVTLSGRAVGAAPGGSVQLYASPYPYRHPSLVATVPLPADGSFSHAVIADRDTSYRAVLAGTGATSTASEDVIGITTVRIRALALGRVRITILVSHPRDLGWGGARVRWAFARSAHGHFRVLGTNRTRRRGPYTTELQMALALPAGRFSFRACFHARQDHALDDLERPPGCTGRGYRGGGRLPEGFPGPAAVDRATRYLERRAGLTGFAVVDSEGRLSGSHIHRTFITASVVKAMLMVADLRRLHALGRHRIDSTTDSILFPMIHVSDNTAASRCFAIVGTAGLYDVARAAGMTDFSVAFDWGQARLSPADQARFFFVMDSLIPHEFVGYARFLLSTIVDYESWGIPAVARPLGYRVFFKGGWRTTGLGQLVHQIARLERRGRTFSLAVMTDGDPSMGYGIDTIQGVTGVLLR
jgi:hypothetical protein